VERPGSPTVPAAPTLPGPPAATAAPAEGARATAPRIRRRDRPTDRRPSDQLPPIPPGIVGGIDVAGAVGVGGAVGVAGGVDVAEVADALELGRLVAELDAELADLECRRYTDPRGIGGRARQVVETARAHGLTAQKYRGRLILADQASRTEDVAGAIETARLILLHARGHDELTVMARSKAIIAWCLFRIGAIGDAAAHAVEAVQLLPPEAPPHLSVDHRMILALLNGMQSPDEGYVDVFEGVLAGAERLANPHLLLAVLNNYAWTHQQHDRSADARPLVERMRAVSAAAGIELNSTILDTIASVLLDIGELEAAEAVALAMMNPGLPEAEVRATPEAMLTLARIRARRGAAAEALDLVCTAEGIAAERGLPDITAAATLEKSRLLAEAGDHRGAYAALLLSHETWVHVRDREAEARASSLHALFETEQARRRSLIFEELADRDPLTGLWNRRHLDRLLPGMLTDHQVAETPLSLAIIDVDHFKQINDERSHLTGDAVLARIGEVLGALVAEPGFAARLGGEEFVLVLPGADLTAAHEISERARVLIGTQRWDPITDGLAVTVSVGFATSAPSATVSRLLNAADEQLYDAKHAGRDRVRPALDGPRSDPPESAAPAAVNTQR
jgi:two-component system cell cycle response regulator